MIPRHVTFYIDNKCFAKKDMDFAPAVGEYMVFAGNSYIVESVHHILNLDALGPVTTVVYLVRPIKKTIWCTVPPH